MQIKKRSGVLTALVAMITVTLFMTGTRAAAQKERVLYSFDGDSIYAPAHPTASLISDAAGNFYGTTLDGGASCAGACGTAFELSPQPSGGWKQIVLHSFQNDGQQGGYYPRAGLVSDPAGNLYGAAYLGGNTSCDIFGSGTVFELLPTVGGGWKEKVLHSFDSTGDCTDGSGPYGGLNLDAAGNLYGTTSAGGVDNYGTVFELSPSAGGSWTETVLHSFNGYDGQAPYASLIFDPAGNLYGTTTLGGNLFYGTVFELSPASGGRWTEKVLHSFDTGSGGYQPQAGVILDAAGNLYGTTTYGGIGTCTNLCGTVFELSPTASGGWTKKTLHHFTNNGKDGYAPGAGLTFDHAGNLYGTTEDGGNGTSSACSPGCGTVFELTPAAGGGWAEKVLHNFGQYKNDGQFPEAGVVFDTAGNLYGTTNAGGAILGGTVFQIAP